MSPHWPFPALNWPKGHGGRRCPQQANDRKFNVAAGNARAVPGDPSIDDQGGMTPSEGLRQNQTLAAST